MLKKHTYVQREVLLFLNNSDPVHPIRTIFGMDILLDPRNKPAEEFFVFLKIQDGCLRSKEKHMFKGIFFLPAAAILDFGIGQKFFRKLVPWVK